MENTNKIKNETVEKVLDIFNNDFSKQVILYGPPGTSKTYCSALIAANFLEGGEYKITEYKDAKEKLKGNYKDRYKIVQFHPSYNYDDFVRGIKMEIITEKGESSQTTIPKYESVNKVFGEFAKAAYESINDDGTKPRYLLVIDEINRAPLASVLGELIYGLEYRGQNIVTPYKVGGSDTIVIPENLYIIGTMNTADRSIGSIDYAVRRRFAFVPVLPDANEISKTWYSIGSAAKRIFEALILNKKNDFTDDKEKGIFQKSYLEDDSVNVDDIKIGHTYFMGKKAGNTVVTDKETDEVHKNEWEYLKYRLEYQVKPIYQEYINDGLIRKDKGKEGLNTIDNIIKKVNALGNSKEIS